MTIKELAYSVQQLLQAKTATSFKRAHIYELLAASFGFNSQAAFSVDTVLAELCCNDSRSVPQCLSIRRRCIELGYQPDIATLVTSALESFLTERQIGIASISSVISRLRGAFPDLGDELEYDEDELFNPSNEALGPILLDGLDAAASKGHALAHYALALIYAPDDEDDLGAGSSYWYAQMQQGRVLTGVEKEWAEAHAYRLAQAEKYAHHLKAAGRLGHQDALLDLADRFDDPSFFEQSCLDIDADPAAVADIAERMGRPADVRHWLTIAAENGDTDAMLQLIEDYDHMDLQRCWTWMYLSQLVGTDLSQDAHYAINEDGSDYDDDVGGPIYVAGRGGVDLAPLAPAQDAIAKLAAQRLFNQIEQNVR